MDALTAAYLRVLYGMRAMWSCHLAADSIGVKVGNDAEASALEQKVCEGSKHDHQEPSGSAA